MPHSTDVLADVSEAIAALYRASYDLAASKVYSHLAEDVLICVLEDLGTVAERTEAATVEGILDQRRAFQRDHEADFCAAVERLTGRRVRTFLSANHVSDGIAAEVFFLEREELD